MQITASKVTTLISMIPNIINGQKYYNCTRARKKKSISVLSDEFCEELKVKVKLKLKVN